NVLNFRDAGAGKKSKDGRYVRHGMIFRSANPYEASRSDTQRIVNDLGISSILDLRSSQELHKKPVIDSKTSEPTTQLIDYYTGRGDDRMSKGIMHKVDLLKPLKNVVWGTLPFFVRLWGIFLVLTGYRAQAQKYLLKNSFLEQEGLFGLYKTLIMHSQREMKQVFTVLSQPKSYPLLIHCTAGKDRTGLTVENIIVSDYALSGHLLRTSHAKIVVEAAKLGLSPQFADVPPEVMVKTLSFIREKFGSVDAYWTHLGFPLEKRTALKDFLLTHERQ
ncbi:protein-tyrosine phosphatase-like protein, partial [Chytridium lagenaria]